MVKVANHDEAWGSADEELCIVHAHKKMNTMLYSSMGRHQALGLGHSAASARNPADHLLPPARRNHGDLCGDGQHQGSGA